MQSGKGVCLTSIVVGVVVVVIVFRFLASGGKHNQIDSNIKNETRVISFNELQRSVLLHVLDFSLPVKVIDSKLHNFSNTNGNNMKQAVKYGHHQRQQTVEKKNAMNHM